MFIRNVFLLFLMLFAFQAMTQVKTFEKFSDFETTHLKNLSEDTIYVVNFWAT